MPRALAQILAELDPVYRPQKDLYNQQITGLDPQMQAEEQGLQATQRDSFAQIQQGANRRGLNFSGIPLQEQAQYTGQSFLPAVANLKAKYVQHKFNLQDAIAKITQEQYNMAYGIQGKEADADAQMEAARAAGRAGGGSSGGGGFGGFEGGGGQTAQGASRSATAAQRAGGGFNFTDARGRPINAAAYAAQKGIPFRTLLQQMANAGDAGARAALGFVGNDFNADPRKITNQYQAQLYKALTGRNIGVSAPGGGGGGRGW